MPSVTPTIRSPREGSLRARLALRILLAAYLGWFLVTCALAGARWRLWALSLGVLAFVHAALWFHELRRAPAVPPGDN